MTNRDIVIIGGGPAGMAAAISAYEAGVKDVLIIERDEELGGILNQCVHHGFGIHRFGEALTGPEYAAKYIEMLKSTSVEVKLNTTVLSIENKRVCVVSEKDGFEEIQAKAIILSMGCRERNRGPIFVTGDRGVGVFTAGSAQRYLNIEGYLVGKRVVILGSGDIGLIMARRMTLEGAKVLAVAEIMPYTNGLSRNVSQCIEDFDIPLYLSHTVTKVLGKNKLEGVVISQVDENLAPIKGTEKTFECDTLLLSVGLVPENELTCSAGIALDPKTRGASVYEDMQTAEKGVFACGNVLQVHDLVDYVSEESELAGKNAARFVLDEPIYEAESKSVSTGENISYTVPQKIRCDGKSGEVRISFRVSKKIGLANVVIESESEKLASFRLEFATPGEMQRISVAKDLICNAKGNITVSVREVREELQ